MENEEFVVGEAVVHIDAKGNSHYGVVSAVGGNSLTMRVGGHAHTEIISNKSNFKKNKIIFG